MQRECKQNPARDARRGSHPRGGVAFRVGARRHSRRPAVVVRVVRGEDHALPPGPDEDAEDLREHPARRGLAYERAGWRGGAARGPSARDMSPVLRRFLMPVYGISE
eukprot:gene9409-biopygen13625